MQFCAGTARQKPFRAIFGVGTVYTCRCRTRDCPPSRDVRRRLETGDRDTLRHLAADFPCDLTDTRFDPERALRAGDRYIRDLAADLGGNLYLIYIGYNSGPSIAREVYRRLGHDPDARLADIELHLTDVMRPVYGAGSSRRARSLLRTHLPKLARAFRRYHRPAAGLSARMSPDTSYAGHTPADRPR
jgi:hypothetical protein